MATTAPRFVQALLLMWFAPAAMASELASDVDLAQEDRILELERTVAVLVDELERTRTEMAVPEDKALKARYGRGPAASKIYDVFRGLSIGGYGEAYYRKIVGDAGSGKSRKRDSTDLLRMVIYTGYKFTENIVFNTEVEFEHATTGSTITSGGGSASVEFAYLDFFWRDWANFRAGLLLLPMGFVNEIHEPPYFLGVNRPEVERQIIPSTWRENGAGVFGSLGEGLDYQLYVVNGLNAEGFSPSGLRGGRQKGNRALAEHLAVSGRVDWYPYDELQLGGSFYVGNSGQNQTLAGTGSDVRLPDTLTTIWEVHTQYENRGLHLRGLFTMAHIEGADDLTRALQGAAKGTGSILKMTEAIGGQMLGGYGEISYDVMPLLRPESEMSLMPFYRYEYYDTQRDMPDGFSADGNKRRQIHTVGMQFKPISNVVLKLDLRKRSAEEGTVEDEVNLGIGYAF